MSTISTFDNGESSVEKVANVKHYLRYVKIRYVKDFERLKPDLMSLVEFAKAQLNSVKVKLSIFKGKCLFLDLSVNYEILEVVKDDVIKAKSNAIRSIISAIRCIKDDTIESKAIVSP